MNGPNLLPFLALEVWWQNTYAVFFQALYLPIYPDLKVLRLGDRRAGGSTGGSDTYVWKEGGLVLYLMCVIYPCPGRRWVPG